MFKKFTCSIIDRIDKLLINSIDGGKRVVSDTAVVVVLSLHRYTGITLCPQIGCRLQAGAVDPKKVNQHNSNNLLRPP